MTSNICTTGHAELKHYHIEWLINMLLHKNSVILYSTTLILFLWCVLYKKDVK